MPNVCVRVSVGKMEANEKGREYKFSIGNPKTKMSNENLLNIIEVAIEDKLTSIFGKIKIPR